jgi:hypothetical protein
MKRFPGIREFVSILALGWAMGIAPATAAEPVGITAINARTGVVTAVDGARSRTIQFKVENAKLLKGLAVGQIVSADFDASKVGLAPGAPCCAITSVQGGAAGSQPGAVGSAAMNAPNDPLGTGGIPRKVTNNDYPNCGICAGACKVCSDWGQECRCNDIGSGVWTCHCTGANPQMPRK